MMITVAHTNMQKFGEVKFSDKDYNRHFLT